MAVVTGGSRGIGAAVCERLACHGAFVYGIYKANQAAAGCLQQRLGDRFVPLCADVTDDRALQDAFQRVRVEKGRLDILVNSAGGPADALLLRSRPKKVREVLELNLDATINSCRLALPMMIKARYGRIVNISSVVAAAGNAGQTIYAAAKAGVEGFSRSLAREVGSRGITVNCVAPGLVDTDLTARLAAAPRERALAASVAGRMGTAGEMAHAVVFLCEEGSGYVTGAVLQVNGGMYM